MAVVVTIAGVDRTAYVEHPTLAPVVIKRVLGEPTTCSFQTKDTNGSYYPSIGQPVVITKEGTVIFGGVIRTVARERVNDVIDLLWCDVECTDYNFILERRLAGEYYYNDKTGAELITAIHTQSLDDEGITLDDIEDGPTFPKFSTRYSTVAAAFGQVAEESDNYVLRIDDERALQYFPRGQRSAPFNIGVAPTNLTWMRATETDEDYCNLVIGYAGQAIRDPQIERFTGDGVSDTFTLAFPVSSIPIIRVNGEHKSVGISSVDVGRDWYWQQSSNEIRQGENTVPLATTDTLEVEYSGTEGIYLIAKDDGEIAARAAIEGSSGRYERFIEIDRMLSRGDAQAVVDAYLNAHCLISLIVEYRTHDKHEPQAMNLRPGDTQSILVDGWAAQDYGYLVRGVTATSKKFPENDAYTWEYQVEAIRGSLTKTTFQWFRELAGSSDGASVPPGETEYIHFFLGGCAAVSAGTDVSPHHPIAFNAGRPIGIATDTKTAPSTGDLVFDVKFTNDGTTWVSLFANGSMTHPQGRSAVLFGSNFSPDANIARGAKFRVDVTSGGGAEGWSIKIALAPVTGRFGSLVADGSPGTGITGTDEQTEMLLVL